MSRSAKTTDIRVLGLLTLLVAPALSADPSHEWASEIVRASGGGTLAGVFPFSFTYAGKPAHVLLPEWKRAEARTASDDAKRCTIHWDDPAGGLRVSWQVVQYDNYPAVDWVLWFENRGTSDTEIIENIQSLDVAFRAPLAAGEPRYRLYRTKGGPACPADFEPSTVAVDRQHPQTLTAGQGRSSHAEFPFFKIDTARGSAIIAVGWSGMWKSQLTCDDDRQLVVKAGLEKTRFRLRPGERVRSPRIAILTWCGDTWDANACFRRLIYRHYAAKRSAGSSPADVSAAKPPLPILFCNTCFTRGGGWLNECNAENQISLIKAYAPLGLEALLTDAGWFEGGWPAGAGNWNPRKDAYPDGMKPVAAAAKDNGLVYGLWFEPERVVAGTWLHKNKPQWLLRSEAGEQGTYLLNFGLPEVRQYFFNIVKEFMELPGFRFYRQDFNMDPLPYWRFNDAADRQGITEMKYIEGLYAYWDSIATAWPDSIREECASGGNRIDLETVLRMHLHQKTDYWFDNQADQSSLWGLSQYLPNGVVVAHLNRMDDYSFHSVLPSSLCMGWIADAADFDSDRGKKLLGQYLAVRHLLVGDWYPLLPCSRDLGGWTGSQFHRSDLDGGMLLIYRRAQSPYRSVDVKLRALHADGSYEMDCYVPDGTRQHRRIAGAELMNGILLALPSQAQSDLITYRRIRP